MDKPLAREAGVQPLSAGNKPILQQSERRRLEPQVGGGEAQSKRQRLQARTAPQWGTSTSSSGGESIATATIAGLYDLEETIGKGHFAVVKAARHVFTDERVAVKIIDRTKLGEKERLHLFQEVMCMKLVQHRYIVRLYEVMDTQTRLYLVLELADGGDLFDYIMRHRDGLAEVGARRYFRQICTAIAYCHALHVVHRDLKPENVVFFERRRVCKLTDFGFSQRYTPGTQLETACGSLYYSAPEILLGDRYDAPKVDVWSLGVILFMLVCGRAPFQEANDSETLSKIMDCDFRVPVHVSASCRNLIANMLLRDPARRLSLERILVHEWTIGPACNCNFSAEDSQPPASEPCAACECEDDEEDEQELCDDLHPLVTRTALSKEQHDAIVSHMVNGGIAPREAILDALANDPYSHIAATFFLLAERTLREQRERSFVPQRRPRLASGSGPRRNPRPHVPPSPAPAQVELSPSQPQQTVNASGERDRETARERAPPAPTVLEVVPESDSPYASDGSALNLRESGNEGHDSDELTEQADDDKLSGNRPLTIRPSSSDSCLSTQFAGILNGNSTLAVPIPPTTASRRCSQIKEESGSERHDAELHSSIHDSRSSQSSRRSSRAGVNMLPTGGAGGVICLSRRSSTSSLAAVGVSPAHMFSQPHFNASAKRHSLHGDLTYFLLAAAASISNAASLSPMHGALSASASVSPVPSGLEPHRGDPLNALSFSVPSSRQPTVEVSEMIIEEEFEASLNANASTPTGSEPGCRPGAPPLRNRPLHPRRLHRSLDHSAAVSRSSSSDASDTDEQVGVALPLTAGRRQRRGRPVATHKYSLPLANTIGRGRPPSSATSVSLPFRTTPSRSDTCTTDPSLPDSSTAPGGSRSSTPGALDSHMTVDGDESHLPSRYPTHALKLTRDHSPASSTVETSVELMDADADEQLRLLDQSADESTALASFCRPSATRSCVSDSGDCRPSSERRSRASKSPRDDELRVAAPPSALPATIRVRESLALRERSRSEGFGNVNMRSRAIIQQRKKRNSVNTQQTAATTLSASCSPHAGKHLISIAQSPSPSHAISSRNSQSRSVAQPPPSAATAAQHAKVKKSDSNFSCKSDSWVTYSAGTPLVASCNPTPLNTDSSCSNPLGDPLPVSLTVAPTGGCTTIHEEECEQLAADAAPATPRAPLADYDSMSDLAVANAPSNDPQQSASASLRRSSSSTTAAAHRPSSVLLSGSHTGAQTGWRKSSSYSVPAAPTMSRQSSNYSVSVSASSNFSLASLCSSIRSTSRYRVADVQMTRTPSSTAMLVVHTLDKSRDDSEQPQVVNVLFDTYSHFATPARSFSQHTSALPPRASKAHRSRNSRSQSHAPSGPVERPSGRRSRPLQRGDAQSDDGCAAHRKCSFDSLIEARRNPVLSDTLNSPTTDSEEQHVVQSNPPPPPPPPPPPQTVDPPPVPVPVPVSPPKADPQPPVHVRQQSLPPSPEKAAAKNVRSFAPAKHDSSSASSADGDRLAVLCGVFGRRRSAGAGTAAAGQRPGNSPVKHRLAAVNAPQTDPADDSDVSAMQSPLWLGNVHKHTCTNSSQSAPSTLQRPAGDGPPDTRRTARRTVQCCTVS